MFEMVREPRRSPSGAGETSYGKWAALAIGGLVGAAMVYSAITNMIEPPSAAMKRENTGSGWATMTAPAPDARSTDGSSR